MMSYCTDLLLNINTIYTVYIINRMIMIVICLQEIMGVEYFVSLYMYINIVSIRYKQDSIVKR